MIKPPKYFLFYIELPPSRTSSSTSVCFVPSGLVIVVFFTLTVFPFLGNSIRNIMQLFYLVIVDVETTVLIPPGPPPIDIDIDYVCEFIIPPPPMFWKPPPILPKPGIYIPPNPIPPIKSLPKKSLF